MVWLVSLWSDSNSVGHILLVYAIVITVGLLLGRIKIFGISLGVTFVLFAGLAAGYFGFTVNTTVMHFLRDFGLILFVFFIGLQVGPSFFSSFRSGGIQLNLLTLLAVFLSLAVTVGLYFAFSDTVSLPQMLGVYFGAVTNTPGLGATQEALNMLDYKGEDIAVAYACAYPLAVVAIIATSICLRFIFRIDLKEEDRMWEEAEKENNEAPIFFHVKVTNAALEGKQLEQLRNFIGRPFICSRLLHKGTIISPHAKDTVHVGDVMRIVASAENKDAITVFCGSEDKDVDLATESSPITARNIRVTRSAMNGLTVHDLHLSRYDGVNITRIFRAGMTLFPYPHLRFQGLLRWSGALDSPFGRQTRQSGKETRSSEPDFYFPRYRRRYSFRQPSDRHSRHAGPAEIGFGRRSADCCDSAGLLRSEFQAHHLYHGVRKLDAP